MVQLYNFWEYSQKMLYSTTEIFSHVCSLGLYLNHQGMETTYMSTN